MQPRLYTVKLQWKDFRWYLTKLDLGFQQN